MVCNPATLDSRDQQCYGHIILAESGQVILSVTPGMQSPGPPEEDSTTETAVGPPRNTTEPPAKFGKDDEGVWFG